MTHERSSKIYKIFFKKEKLNIESKEALQNIPLKVNIDKISVILDVLSHSLCLKMAFLLLERDLSIYELIQQTQKELKLVTNHLKIMREIGIIQSCIQAGEELFKINDSFALLLKELRKSCL